MVDELVSEFGIESARLTRSGQVKAAHNQATLRAAIDEAEWMKREMGDTEVRILDAHQVRTNGWRALAVVDPRSCGIHPLKLRACLAKGAARAGCADIPGKPCARAPSRRRWRYRRDGRWQRARASGDHHHRLFSDLTSATSASARVRCVRSALIATEKLSPNLAGSLMPTSNLRRRDQADDALVPQGRRSRHLRRPRRFRQTGFGERLRGATPCHDRYLPGSRMFRWSFAGPDLSA